MPIYSTSSLGGGTPASTVTDETTWGVSPAVGSSENFAREDHTHGTPADPSGSCTVPIGGIIMYAGTFAEAAALSPTWEVCDGTANSPGPDLRDKFIVGAKQDDAGVAKTNIEGSLSQTGGSTGHIHSSHAALSHANGAVGDHTGLTHGLSIANHPDLTHAALASHPALTIEGQTHANVTLPGYTHPVLTIEGMTHAAIPGATHPVLTIEGMTHGAIPGATHAVLTIEGQTHPVQSIASRNDLVAAALTHADLSMASRSVVNEAIAGKASFASGTNRSGMTSVPTHSGSMAASTYTFVSHPTHSVTHPAWSISPASHPTFTASAPASHPTTSIASHPTFTASAPASHPTTSIASHPTFTASAPASHPTETVAVASHPTFTASGLTHGGVGTHVGTDYGVHTITAPPAHGTAGTVTHSFTQPDAHDVSAHDTVSQVIPYYALAFIQRME